MYSGAGWAHVKPAFADNTLHVITLLSSGGVHSRYDQVLKLCQGAVADGCKKLRLHVLTDGRDVPDNSCHEYMRVLVEDLAKLEGCDAKVASGGVDGGLELPPDFRMRYSYFPTVPKPIIAAINGPAAGLGLIMSLYCDMRFAAESAVMTTAFSRRGLIAEHGISWMLPALVGHANALDLLLSGRKVTAQEARDMGLVNQVYPDEGFMDAVNAYAREMATMVSPRSIRVMKQQVYRAVLQSLEEATLIANAEMPGSFVSEDFKEGVAHFVERRAPNFTGR